MQRNDATGEILVAAALESIRMHPDQETLLGMMQEAGFERCRYQNLAGGIVALHIGYRV